MTKKGQCVITIKTAEYGVRLPNVNPGSTTYQQCDLTKALYISVLSSIKWE